MDQENDGVVHGLVTCRVSTHTGAVLEEEQRIFIHLMTSDRKLEASTEGSK